MSLNRQDIFIVDGEMVKALDIMYAVDVSNSIALTVSASIQAAIAVIENGKAAAAFLESSVCDCENTPASLALVERQMTSIVYTGALLPPCSRARVWNVPVRIKPIPMDRLVALLSCKIADYHARPAHICLPNA